MKKTLQFLDLLNDYLNSYLINDRGMSLNTRETYRDAFKLLLNYFYDEHKLKSDEIQFADLNFETITGYLDWIENIRGCSVNTRNQRLAVLKSFSDYTQIRSVDAALSFRREILKIRKKKYAEKDMSYFTKEEVKALIDICPDTSIGKRNKILVAFMYCSGARAQEICELRVRDIQFVKDHTYITLHGKGKKSRQISIPSQPAELLQQYLTLRIINREPDRHVFSSQTHEYMTISCIEGIYKKLISDARKEYSNLFLMHYSPHSMRHTTATHMVEAGIPLIVIKNFMGHSSIQTTQIYAKISQENLNKQTEQWNNSWLSGANKSSNTDPRNDNIPLFLK